MKTQTDREILCVLNWMQTTLRGRGSSKFEGTLQRLNEVDVEFRRVVDAPRTAIEQQAIDTIPEVVTRLRHGQAFREAG